MKWAKFAGLALAGLLWAANAAAQTPVQPGQQICNTTNGPTVCAWQPTTSANPFPVNVVAGGGTISGGFTAGAPATPLAVTNASATSGAVTGTIAVVTNVGGTNTAYCVPGNGPATTSGQPITPNGGWFAFQIASGTAISCITSTSTTTVNVVGGTGLPTGTSGTAAASSGGTSSSYGASFPSTGTAAGAEYLSSPPALTTGQMVALQTTVAGSLHTTVDNAPSVQLNATPSLANGNGVVPTQGGNVLSATNGIYSNPLQGNAVLSATNGGYTNILQGNAALTPAAGLPVAPSPYPSTAVPITASATGTTAATTATLTNVSGHTTYICGFSIRANATAAATGNATVTGTITGTLNFTQWTAPLASGLGVTEEAFVPCVPASAVSTSINIISAAPGTGGVVSVTGWGYSI